MRGELIEQRPQTQFRLPKFNFVDELLQYVSARTGEELEFAKKSILHLLEHEICSNHCTHLIDKLIKATNAFKNNSLTKHSILHSLCVQGETDVIRMLLKLKPTVDFNLLDRDGISPAFYAMISGHTDIAQLLISHQFKPVGPKEAVVRLYQE